MAKTNTTSFVTPLVKSVSRGGAGAVEKNQTAGFGMLGRSSSKSLRRLKLPFGGVQVFSFLSLIGFGALLMLHVFWVNTYSAKGFELKRAQSAIEEQTAMQKKLLVQQSLLNSTATISKTESGSLVSVTDVEYIAGNSFAQAK